MPATNIRRTRPDPIARITRGRETSQIRTQESDDKTQTHSAEEDAAEAISAEEDAPTIISTTS